MSSVVSMGMIGMSHSIQESLLQHLRWTVSIDPSRSTLLLVLASSELEEAELLRTASNSGALVSDWVWPWG